MLILDTEADEHRASTANNQTSKSFYLNVSLLTVECYVTLGADQCLLFLCLPL